jgi:hypothetical protein
MKKWEKDINNEINILKKKLEGFKTSLVGKTIKSIKRAASVNTSCDDECESIIVKFTDGTTWKLQSWDAEKYSSGINEEIIKK